MQRYKKIAAISFLSIFSMYLLHQVLPHVHHDHEIAEQVTVSEHSHDSDHHHHDEDANDNTNEDFDLLGLLFGTHAHSVQANNIIVTKNVVKKQSTVRIVTVAAITQLDSLLDSTCDREEQVLWQHPPDLPKTPYLASGSLRGPPSLG